MAELTKLTEQILTAVNMGKTAHVVYGHLKPTLEKLEEGIINIQIGEVRAGKFDASRAHAAFAQLALLQDIETALKSQMHQGDRALTKATNQGE